MQGSWNSSESTDSPTIPSGIRWILTVIIGLHLLAVGITLLAVPSGPWPMWEGPGSDFAETPAFLRGSVTGLARDYVATLRLDETGRYPSLRHTPVQVKYDAVLYDASGKEISKLEFPQPSTLSWTRPWEQMLAQALANDIRREPPPEKSYPPGQEPPKFPVWRSPRPEDPIQRLEWVPEHLLSRAPSPPDWGPDEWGLSLSRSYARYLCRAHGADTVEIHRRWKYQQPPFVVLAGQVPDDSIFAERVSVYGKVSDAGQ